MSRMTLFRGEPAHVWIRRLEQRGWRHEAAVRVARFLTEKRTPPPDWQDLAASVCATSAEPPRPRDRLAHPRRGCRRSGAQLERLRHSMFVMFVSRSAEAVDRPSPDKQSIRQPAEKRRSWTMGDEP